MAIPDIEVALTPQGCQPREIPGPSAFPGQGTQRYPTLEGLLVFSMAVGLSGRRGLGSQRHPLPEQWVGHSQSGCESWIQGLSAQNWG